MPRFLVVPTFLTLGLVTALAVALAAFLFAGGPADPAEAAITGGPVVLMGIDAEDGGIGSHGPISVYVDIVNDVLSNVTNGGSGILVIGGGKDTTPPVGDVTEFWDKISTDTGVAVTYVNGAGSIGGQSFSGFAMIAVVSDENETSDGGLTQAENDALAARIGDIAAFVNGGGGLLGFSQTGFSNPYAYIGGIGSFAVTTGLDYEEITPTAAGLAVGITDDLDLCCWHDVYLTFPGFLEVLATQDDDEEDFLDEAAAIGGAEVIILPEGPFGDPTCSDKLDNDADDLTDGADPDCWVITLDPPTATNDVGTDHTVTATILSDPDGPVSGVDVDFTVAGQNDGAGTGTTDASGEADFTYTGAGGTGDDTIQACFLDNLEEEHCATATKTWVEPTPTPTASPTALPAVQTPTPTPTPVVLAAAALPQTGGEPADGNSGVVPWLAAIAGAIAVMSAGGVWLAYGRRRVR